MTTTSPRRDVVVVGGSAGAIESLVELLGKLPDPIEAAVAVVVHLNPYRESKLDAVLGRTTRVPVTDAADRMPFVAGTIYLAVPDYHLLVGPQLSLGRGPKEHFSRPAVDVLFRSAATAFGDRVIAVLLSSANTDGLSGAVQVKGAGGLVLVEAPEHARHDRLAAAVLAQNCADASLSIDELANTLAPMLRSQADDR